MPSITEESKRLIGDDKLQMAENLADKAREDEQTAGMVLSGVEPRENGGRDAVKGHVDFLTEVMERLMARDGRAVQTPRGLFLSAGR